MKKIALLFFTILFISSVGNAQGVSVNSYEELKNAITNLEPEIDIESDFSFNESIKISGDIIINGNDHIITRDDSFLNGLFSINATSSLEINDLTIDGGAENWEMDIENRYYTGANNNGYVRIPTINTDGDLLSTVSLITNEGTLKINNSTIANNWCSVTGSVLKGKGNVEIFDSTFTHNGSKTNGGCFYLTGGTLNISNSTFKNNTAGVEITTVAHGGAIYATGLSSIIIKDDTLFEDNLTQGNAGAMYIIKSNLQIKDTIFRHNMVGNDGSAIDLQSKVDGYSVLIEDTIFEKNIGFATTGQSMGTIYLEQWNSPKDDPIVLKNVIFRENVARTGGAIADIANGGKGKTNVYLENVEIYENEIGSGALAYIQGADYVVTDLNIHDNNVTAGASFYISNDVEVLIENSIITNNTGTSSGIGIYMIAGNVTVRDTEISNNTSTGARGAGIFVRGYYTGYNPSLTIENSVITNNSAATTGGGIAIADNADVFSNIVIDDKTKIYDNSAGQAGDDFSYVRANNSDNSTDNTITLDNISIAGIVGIDGWYQDNSGDRFSDTENPTTFTAYVNNDGTIDFFLKAAGVSTATYDGNGGDTGALPVTVKYGETYVVDDDIPVKEGYTFQEWNTKPDGTGISLNAGDVYDGSDGYVLYAILELNQYTITFDTKGGTEIAPIKQDYDTDVTAPEDPEKEGHTFKGWDKEIPEKMPAEDMTITASWDVNEYTITFDTKGGTEIAPIKQDYDTDVTAPEDPEKEGYVFKGWDKEIPEKMPAEDMTITADWEIDKCTITFDTKGGTKIPPINQDYDTDVTAPNNPTKEGYTFKGWDKEIPEKMPAEDITITAEWEVNKYTITFDTKGGTEIAPINQDYDTDVTAPNNPTKEGYTFKGWDKEIPEKMPAEDMTITASWEINVYTITFNTDGGTEIKSQDLEYGEVVEKPDDPKKEGYIFIGWDKDIPETMPAEDITITASWRKRSSSSSSSSGSSSKKNLDISTFLSNEKREDKGNNNYYLLGEEVTYFVDYENVGPAFTNTYKLTLDLPLAFTEVELDGGTVSGKTITWTIPSGMKADETGRKTVKVKFTEFSKGNTKGWEEIYPTNKMYVGSTLYDECTVHQIIYTLDNDIDSKHIIYMYGDEEKPTFRPDDIINRAEGALVLTRIFEIETSNVLVRGDEFSDLSDTYLKAQQAIVKASQLGLIAGYEDGTYKPRQKMTRAEFMSIISRFVEYKSTQEGIKGMDIKEIQKDSKLYKKAGHWADKYVLLLARLNMTPVDIETMDSLNRKITRAEVAQLCNMYLLRAPVKNDDRIELLFEDVDNSHKLFGDIVEATRPTHNSFKLTENAYEIWDY